MPVNLERVLTVTERILGYAIDDHGVDTVKAAIAQRDDLHNMLSQLVGSAPSPVYKTKPFFVQGNRFYKDNDLFKFTGANMRGLAWYGKRMSATRSLIPVQLDSAKALGMQVIRFYVSHNEETVETAIPLVENVLNQLALRNMYGIAVLTDGAQSGFMVKDTPLNRGGTPDRYTQRWVDGGFRENYKPYVDRMTKALSNHPGLFSWEIMNEYTATIFPLTIQQADNLLTLIDEISTMICTNSPNSMCSFGYESGWQAWVNHAYDGGQYVKKMYALENIHFGTFHTYRSDNPLGSTHEHIEKELLISGKPQIIEETNTYPNETATDWYDRLVDASFPRVSGILQWNMSFPYCIDTGDADGLYNCDRIGNNGARWHNHIGFWKALSDRLKITT